MNFFTILVCKIKIIMSNKLLLFFLLLSPIATAYIAGYASNLQQSNVIPISIIDDDKSETSELIKNRLQKNKSLKIYFADKVESEYLLQNSKIETEFWIKDGFEEKIKNQQTDDIIELRAHIKSPNYEFAKEYIASEVNRILTTYYTFDTVKNNYIKKNISTPKSLFKEVSASIELYWNPKKITYNFVWNNNDGITNKKNQINTAYHGVILLFIMLFVMFGSTWITEEKTNKIFFRLASTKTGFATNFFANIVALLIGSIGLIFIIIISIKIVFNYYVLTDLSQIVIYIFYTLNTISIGILIGCLSKSALTISSISAPLTFLTSYIGGCFFNLSEISEKAKSMTLLTPQGWALSGMINNFSLSMAVLGISSLIFILIAYKVLRGKTSLYA